MGMNVNLGTGVNNYAQKMQGASYSTNANNAVNPFAQPAYDTVSFSGNTYSQIEEQEGMGTKAKVGLVATAATLIVGAIAASKGKKLNNATSKEAQGLLGNIGTGLKAMFTKAGRDLYKANVTDKIDNTVKATINASKTTAVKQQGATKFTQETMEAAGANAKKAQNKISSLQNQISKLDPAKDSEKIKQLKAKIAQQEKSVNKFINLTTSENLASDKAYTKLKETKTAAQEALDKATNKKTTLEKSKKTLEKKKQAIENISKKNRTSEQIKQLNQYNTEIKKIDTKIQNIINGTKDANGKVVTKPLTQLKTEHSKALQATKQYKQAAKALSEAQVNANNVSQSYKQMLEKKNATLTPTQNLIEKVDELKIQAGDSQSTLDKLKKAWEEFAKTGKYDEKIFGKI